MNSQCILIHYHEIGLKGDNRSWFEKIFINNIKVQINNLPYKKIKLKAARVIIIGIDVKQYENYLEQLHNVMGLKHACLMSATDLNEDCINEAVQHQIKDLNFETFRISTKRQDKNFHLTSQETNQLIGAQVVERTSKKVNLNNPELNIQLSGDGLQGPEIELSHEVLSVELVEELVNLKTLCPVLNFGLPATFGSGIVNRPSKLPPPSVNIFPPNVSFWWSVCPLSDVGVVN